MQTRDVTEKEVPAFEARRQFGKLLKAVEGGNKFVVQKNGEDVAALVPMRVYKQWKRAQDDFFALLEEAQNNANLTPEEAERLANDAVKAVRTANLV